MPDAEPTVTGDARKLAISARAVTLLVDKLRDQCEGVPGELPRDELGALAAQAETVHRLFAELAGARRASAGDLPDRPRPAEPVVAPDDEPVEAAPASSQGEPAEAQVEADVEPTTAERATSSDQERSDAMRLMTLDMATAGHAREDVGVQLAEVFAADEGEVSEVLDQVFGDDDRLTDRDEPERRGRFRGRRR